MTLRRAIHSPIFAFLVLLAIWAAAIGVCVSLAVRDPRQELRHPAITGSAAATVGWMILAWATMRFADRLARLLWTFGLATLFVHLVLAFGLAHGWSHEAAVEHVRTVGGSGAGIVVNYLFALAWAVDVVWWWVNPITHANRPRWIAVTVHGFLAFVVVNATVIFGPAERRVVYAVGLFMLAAIAWRKSDEGKTPPQPLPQGERG
ncbi:MAG: hypothetical protein K8U57_28160 [Planctomycetes bacterium]|nr:hypothetical protein [Planctomycetota bacterium]